jgi:(2Fe-2S) ferredoxin
VSRKLTVIVCRGPTCGDRRSSATLYEHLERTIAARQLGGQISLGWETCFGHCLRGPNILVYPSSELDGALAPAAVLYNRMTLADLDRVIDKHLLGGMVVRPLLNRPPVRDG